MALVVIVREARDFGRAALLIGQVVGVEEP
jgi:hypothetical protein